MVILVNLFYKLHLIKQIILEKITTQKGYKMHQNDEIWKTATHFWPPLFANYYGFAFLFW